MEELSAPDESVRQAAMIAAGRMHIVQAVETIISNIGDEDSRIMRLVGCHALIQIGTTRAVEAVLGAVANEEDRDIRRSIVRDIAFGPTPGTPSVLIAESSSMARPMSAASARSAGRDEGPTGNRRAEGGCARSRQTSARVGREFTAPPTVIFCAARRFWPASGVVLCVFALRLFLCCLNICSVLSVSSVVKLLLFWLRVRRVAVKSFC